MFLDLFVKVIILFDFTFQSILFFIFHVNFDSHSFDFFRFTKLIFLFIFTIKCNIKFILYFNLNHRFFNCYFFLILLYNFFFNFIIQYLIN